MEMKAFLLAAGKGTRLRPLTYKVPKCLVPIKGIPLLGIWFDLCRVHGISEVLVNLHHLHRQVNEFIENNTTGLNITTFYEERLLGSAGTVLANRNFISKDKSFFIIYSDNLTNMNLSNMLEFHSRHKVVLTMGLFKTSFPQECGIAEIDSNNVIRSFVEKPINSTSHLANAGIYIADEKLFDYIPDKELVDFGRDVLPRLVGRMCGYVINEYFIDIGTYRNYKLANKEWKGL